MLDGVGVGLSRWRLRRGICGLAADQRPAAGAFHPEREDTAAPFGARNRLALRRRNQQGAQPPETVGGNKAKGHELSERVLGLRPQQARALRKLLKEERAAPAK